MAYIIPYSVILISIILDQITKILAQALIINPYTFMDSSYEVTPFFNLVGVYNRGISFGILNGGVIPPWVFIGFTLCVCIFLFLWLRKEKNRWPQIFLSLIIGGALGNALDRLIRSAVFDFLDFHWGVYHWPAFNIADSCIVIGVILLFLNNLSKTK